MLATEQKSETLLALDTPRLLLDLDRLEHNCALMRASSTANRNGFAT